MTDRLEIKEVSERYGKLTEMDRQFDVNFWQQAGPEAIFGAVEDMIKDYLLIRTGNADKPRLQRTVEHFQKA